MEIITRPILHRSSVDGLIGLSKWHGMTWLVVRAAERAFPVRPLDAGIRDVGSACVTPLGEDLVNTQHCYRILWVDCLLRSIRAGAGLSLS